MERKLTINATGMRVGAIASRAATFLMGKDAPTYSKHAPVETFVTITNAGNMWLSPKKLLQKTYKRYSGHPSGLKVTTQAALIAAKGPEEVLRIAVRGMLPRNRQRPRMLKRLTVEH